MQELQLIVTIGAQHQADEIFVKVKGDFAGMTSGQFNSLFSAAVPLQHWPMGLDMDLLSGFMIVHHLGGKLRIETAPPEGPGFVVTLPTKAPPPVAKTPNTAWFDTVYDSIHAWEEEAFREID
jgi:K+-sensing histidine kinase KdpD